MFKNKNHVSSEKEGSFDFEFLHTVILKLPLHFLCWGVKRRLIGKKNWLDKKISIENWERRKEGRFLRIGQRQNRSFPIEILKVLSLK